MVPGSSPFTGQESRCWKGMTVRFQANTGRSGEREPLIRVYFKIKSRETLVLSFPYSKGHRPRSLNVHAHRGAHLPTGLVDTMDQLLDQTEGLEKLNRSGQYEREKEEQELNRLLKYVIRLRCN